MVIHYTIPVFYNDTIEIPDGATDDEIREAIAESMPKYASVRLWEGVEADAEWEKED